MSSKSVFRCEQPVLQPTHWMLEVGAVLARESPNTAADDLGMLTALDLPTTDDPRVLQRQWSLLWSSSSSSLTPHGVALETPDCVLATADERYLRIARAKSCVTSLTEWQ